MAPRGPVRAFCASDIEAILGGARSLPGFTHDKVRAMRKRLGVGATDRAPTEDALAVMRKLAAFDWCRHAWVEQSPVTLPLTDTIGTTVFSSCQARACPRCGCAESRMWTANGYATLWLRPELPIRRKV